MIFAGSGIRCQLTDHHIAELCFDLPAQTVNKFNRQMLTELEQALDALQAFSASEPVKGLLLYSAKDSFFVGADITEFLGYFAQPEAELLAWLKWVNHLFCRIEDLPYPSVTAINGYALGGGLEIALATSFRVLTADASVGLPETKIGIYPGWGGTVRLSRLIGADNAIEWIASGNHYNATQALAVGLADAIVAPEQRVACGRHLLQQAMAGDDRWQQRHRQKTSALKLDPVEAGLVFGSAKALVKQQAGPHYPAPLAAVKVMQQGASQARDEALALESAGFVGVAKSPTAKALVNIFLGDQVIKKLAKTQAAGGHEVKAVAVLGAGIMGGGIAYQAACKGIRVHLKDINETALQQGLAEATALLTKLIGLQRITLAEMGTILGHIRATLSYDDLKEAAVVVEAVTENPNLKKAVLAEVEAVLKPTAVLTSNTSTLSIDRLAASLKRPEQFCGMHFFNPVHRMPLVEIIRGRQTSPETLATVIHYAQQMGKTPIVVNDCPGFLVNRVLFPYFGGFVKLINEGVAYTQIDRVMEQFGWPMGPAYLLDVVGIDTAFHSGEVMAQAYPERMQYAEKTILQVLYEHKRLGQKNGKGFYRYTLDKAGKYQKHLDPDLDTLIESQLAPPKNVSLPDQDIIDRMMLPMILECSRCLQEHIVSSPIEVDMALVYGLGFPAFRGGVLHYADQLGLPIVLEQTRQYAHLGALYQATEQVEQLAQHQQTFYPVIGA